MVDFLRHPNITLIEADSICFKVGQEKYAYTQDAESYLTLTTTNHNSQLSRQQKRDYCIRSIAEIMRDETLLSQHPSIAPYKNALVKAEIDISDDTALFQAIMSFVRSNGYKALFKLN